MQASMSETRDNLNRNNLFGAKDELEAVIDLSQLLAQAVQEILSAMDQLEELYSMQVKRA